MGRRRVVIFGLVWSTLRTIGFANTHPRSASNIGRALGCGFVSKTMEIKVCGRCKRTKPVEEFSWKRKGVKRQAYCKTCQSNYYKAEYALNPLPYMIRATEQRRELRKRMRSFIQEYLATHPCVDCGQTDPLVLEFDHVFGQRKATIASTSWGTFDEFMREVAKCQVRCANCHTKRHRTDKLNQILSNS